MSLQSEPAFRVMDKMVCYCERWASVANIKDSGGVRGHEANSQSSLHRTGRLWPKSVPSSEK